MKICFYLWFTKIHAFPIRHFFEDSCQTKRVNKLFHLKRHVSPTSSAFTHCACSPDGCWGWWSSPVSRDRKRRRSAQPSDRACRRWASFLDKRHTSCSSSVVLLKRYLQKVQFLFPHQPDFQPPNRFKVSDIVNITAAEQFIIIISCFSLTVNLRYSAADLFCSTTMVVSIMLTFTLHMESMTSQGFV